MFSRLIRNTGYSILSFGLISLVNLTLVPIIIANYSLSALGVLSLLKLFVPTGLLAIFDLGFSENTTIAISQYRAAKVSARQAVARCILNLLLAVSLALITCCALLVTIDLWTELLQIPLESVQDTALVLSINAFYLLLLFPLLVVDGLVKGFERYFLLRTIEVALAVLVFVASLVIVSTGAHFVWLHVVFLTSLGLKLFILLAFTWGQVRESLANVDVSISEDDVTWVVSRSKLMLGNKILGAVQGQLPLLAVGLVFSSASAGLYDIISRLPKLLKVALGLINTAVLPFASLLDSNDDATNMSKLGEGGLLLIGLIILPMISFLITFSNAVLSAWISPAYGQYGIWFSLMMCMPFFSSFVTIMSTPLLSRNTALKKFNQYMLIQIILIYVITFLLISRYDAMAFIIGQVAAAAIVFFTQSRLIFREIRIPADTIRQFVFMLFINIILAFLGFLFSTTLPSLIELSILAVTWQILFFSTCWFAIFNSTQKSDIKDYCFRSLDLLLQKAQVKDD